MGLLVFVGKTILTILNTVFAMLALIMVGFGCLIFYAGDIILPFINLLLQQLSSRGVNAPSSLTIEGFDINALATQVAWPVVMCGAVLFCVAFVGCCGANCENKLLLLIYSICMGVIIAVEILAIVVLAGGQDEWKNRAIAEANTYIASEYKGDNGTDAFSVVLNIAQMGLTCCGITNYTELQAATNWVRTGTFHDDEGNSVTGTLKIPFACCNMSKPFPSLSPYDINCGTTPTTTNSYFETPCYDGVVALVNQYSYWVYIGVAGFIGTEIVILLLSILIMKRAGGAVNPLI